MLGIAGGSASGKSTLAQSICECVRATNPDLVIEVISTDAYFTRGQDNAPAFKSPTTGELEFDCNRPDSIDVPELLTDIENACREADVVIVEGLMILYLEDVRNLFNLKVFVDTDADVRALRRMLRDLKGGRMFSDPENIARYYLESAKPGHDRYVEPSKIFADVILRGDSHLEQKAVLLANLILTGIRCGAKSVPERKEM